MRKLFVAAWVALVSLFAAVPAAADSPITLPPLAPGEVLLEVSAVGIARTPATRAEIVASVSAEGASEAEARRAAAEAVRRVTGAARAAGVAAGDILAGDVSVRSYADDFGNSVIDNAMDSMSGAGEVAAFYGSATVTIRLRNAAAAHGLHAALSGLANVSVGEPDYRLDDDTAARREARAEAIRKARADAETYAAAMNMRVARVLRVTERVGLDFASLAVTENRALMAEAERGGGADSEGRVATYALVGVDFALAPR